MKNLPLLLATIMGTILMVLGISYLFSQQNVGTAQVDQATLLDGARHTKGQNGSNISVVEFSDFQCPACAANQTFVQQLIAQYGDDIQLVYRHMPLDTIHPYARLAASGSEVAASEDKFWPMHDLLFTRQQEWAALSSIDEVTEKLAEYAEELGIDKEQFREKITSEEIKNSINLDVNVASQVNVTATPTFYVNGEKIPASQLLDKVGDLVNK